MLKHIFDILKPITSLEPQRTGLNFMMKISMCERRDAADMFLWN